MRHPTYLLRSRHHIFYFRWPLPSLFRQNGKTAHIKISLQTREPKEALRLSTVLLDHVNYLMKQDWILTMDYIEIKAMVEAHFAKILEERKQEIDKHGPLLPFPMARLKRNIKGIEQSIDGTGEFSVFTEDDSDIAQIIRDYELDLTHSDKDRKRLKMMYWQAARAMMQHVIAYNESQEQFNFGAAPVNANGTPAARYMLAKPENRLERVIEKFIAEKTAEKAWGIRAKAERVDCFAYLMELLGKDFDVPRLDIVTAREVKECLQKTPLNRAKMKQTRGLPLLEQVKVEGVPTLSVGSINKYLQCYSGFLTWAVQHGYTDKNHFEKLPLKGKGNRRDMFPPEQVKMFISEIDKGKSSLLDNDMKYWGVLIAFYTGARLNEIASLTPKDIKQDKKTGIWYFDINDEEEMKRLKTNAATRRVPVHSELIRLGLLDYIEKIRNEGKEDVRLLPGLTFSEKEGWGRKLGRWFNTTFLNNLGIKQKGRSFHSSRHTVATYLRRAGVDNPNVRALIGHEPEGVTEEVYVHDIGLTQLQRDIERLNYRTEEE